MGADYKHAKTKWIKCKTPCTESFRCGFIHLEFSSDMMAQEPWGNINNY
jgi:hypothetical protein